MIKIERDVTQQLLAWKGSADRKPLILRGARQVGKTWAVVEFGKRYYEHLAVFNFDRKRELCGIFEKTKDPDRLIRELANFTEVPLLPEKTLIFFRDLLRAFCPFGKVLLPVKKRGEAVRGGKM